MNCLRNRSVEASAILGGSFVLSIGNAQLRLLSQRPGRIARLSFSSILTAANSGRAHFFLGLCV
jgi:hypothetical protein